MLQSSRDVDKFARTKKRNILIQSPGALNAILILASSQGEASGKTNLVDLYFSLRLSRHLFDAYARSKKDNSRPEQVSKFGTNKSVHRRHHHNHLPPWQRQWQQCKRRAIPFSGWKDNNMPIKGGRMLLACVI